MPMATRGTFQAGERRGERSLFRRAFVKAILVLAVTGLASVGPQGSQAAEKARKSEKEEPAKSSRVDNQVATCTKPADSSPEPATLSAAISQVQNTLTLTCVEYTPGGAVPKNLTEGTVCVSGADKTLENCGRQDSDPAKTIEISKLLGSKEKIVWAAKEKEAAASYSLTLRNEDFPYVDKTFFVGCKKDGQGAECQLNVTVKARTSAVSGQTATCAYGVSSNPSTLEVTMTQEENTFTLVCGTGGTTVPGKLYFQTEFCEGDDVTSCSETSTYRSFLPEFESSWWSIDVQENRHVLKIPPESFPAKEHTFLVGCTLPTEKPVGSHFAACNVKVTVRAKPPASTATRLSYASLGWCTVLLSGSLFSFL
ncbi:srs domain-containing protein [Cystoisospora suis]|uniref:Srs domain-containing protein n=1 Tax=Cystoisospora suis TaxID=483139 RepID=A0A2C6KI68_9APIC|nr:srs domain-containing protein [Cystoisospora suis]